MGAVAGRGTCLVVDVRVSSRVESGLSLEAVLPYKPCAVSCSWYLVVPL